MSTRILVVAPGNSAEELGKEFRRSGLEIHWAPDADSGLVMARRRPPDLVVVARGMDALPKLGRAPEVHAPILLLSPAGRPSKGHREEVLTALRVLAGRGARARKQERTYRLGPLSIDCGRRSLTVGTASVELTPTEFDILRALAERRGRFIGRDELLTLVRRKAGSTKARTIDVHVAALRRKLGPCRPMIVTVRSAGYRLGQA